VINNTGITGALREDIDKLWLDFWVGGITNPLTVIEQISYLMFCRLLDQAEAIKERRAARLKKPYESIYPKPTKDDPDLGLIRWSAFSKIESAERMLAVVRDRVFPFLRGLAGKDSAYGRYMADAALMIVSPQLMYRAAARRGTSSSAWSICSNPGPTR
jgi:type I restriction enzyme M protein